MSLPQHPSRPLEFPVIANIAAIEADNVRVMVERADALLKAQDDGLKAMEARMASVFAQAVALASAAVIGTATAFNLVHAPTNPPVPSTWAPPWFSQSLAVLAVFWLSAVAVSAKSMLSRHWAASGTQPLQFYKEPTLTAPPVSLGLAVARTLQHSINANALHTAYYSRRVALVIGLLAARPFTAAASLLLTSENFR